MPHGDTTDQDRNFESQLFKSVCELLHIHKTRTSAYHPSTNGESERANRTLMNAVRCFIGKIEGMRSIHSAVGRGDPFLNRQMGFIPNRLMLGRETNHQADLMFKLPTETHPLSKTNYVRKLEESKLSATEETRKNLPPSQLKMKKTYGLRVRYHPYSVGDVVCVLDTASKKGKCKKPKLYLKGHSPSPHDYTQIPIPTLKNTYIRIGSNMSYSTT